MAKVIEVENISQAWLEGCRLILTYGISTRKKVKLHNFSICIKSLQLDPRIDNFFKANMDMKVFQRTLDIVASEKIVGDHPNYWRRLIGREEFKTNQITRVISRLKEQPYSTKLTLCVYSPTDFDRKYVPCILVAELRTEREKLYMTVLIRSEDFGSKAYADYIGLARILQYIAEKSGLQPGGMILHIVTGFIANRDVEHIKNILTSLGKKDLNARLTKK
ncbi:MAG: thymidylate synthase [Candidatus Bilamarchaeaceae archaeon]